MKKYFEFSGTISGTNYFLRNLLASTIAFIGGYSLGYGLGSNQMGLLSMGIVIATTALFYGFATIYKRMTALFGDRANIYSIGLISLQVITQFIPEGPLKGLVSLVLIVIGCVLIFKNSNIENHEG